MILIVDDKDENLYSLKMLLQLNLYNVDTAKTGEEALKKILKTDYALIILDVQMPGMDGFEVAETITGYSKTKDIPIIFLSAVNVNKSFITKGFAAGAVDYVTKPFDPDFLLLKVKTFYRLSEQKRELNVIQAALRKEIDSRIDAQKLLEQANLALEEKVAERTSKLQQSNQELEIRNAELQQYAFVASHDLQEPLRKIITFSLMVQDRYLKEIPDANELMSRVIVSTERMRSLIDDLLNLSNLSAITDYVPTDLAQIFAEVTNDLELSIKEKNAQLSIGPLPLLDAVPGQLRQVFQNLLSNALKFSKQGQVPVINAWSESIAEKTIDAAADEQGNYVRIFFQDNGIGFNERYSEKIFTLFQRLHGKSEYAGTGIGLAIVKKIIEKHNGLLSVKSKEGEGSTFIIVLPLLQEDAVTETAVATQVIGN